MRVDSRKTVINVRQKRSLKLLVKKAQETRAAEAIRQAISQIDKAVKNHLIHANKASRMKSQLMKDATTSAITKKVVGKKSTPKKATKKASAKKTAPKKTKK